MQAKSCEFKFVTHPQNKPYVVSSAKFDMSTRFLDQGPFELDIGKGIKIMMQITFKPANAMLDAEMIRRDTKRINKNNGKQEDVPSDEEEKETADRMTDTSDASSRKT